MSFPELITIVGPTASGKSELAIRLAQYFDGEVVSADSMQVYRGMDIGTGKVPVDKRHVVHHGLDLVDPGEPYSVALYQSYARSIINKLISTQVQPILCGGTGFYIRSVIDDYNFPAGEQINNPVRDKYLKMLECEGAQAVWNVLNTLDPSSAAQVHPNNSKRVIRALELLSEGQSYSEQLEKLHEIPQLIPTIMIGLTSSPEFLNARIDSRVDSMIEEGLVQEVEKLLEAGFRVGLTAPQAIGYKEIVEYLDGKCSLDDAINQIKVSTHRYGKRQRSWFNKDKRVNWINIESLSPDEIEQTALSIIKSNNRLD